ncbi:MAG: hypothetical protein J5715_05740 [Clostridiales bacterium]|nr:hypothetical protein [Clostridiales bacterium]
MGMFDKLFGDAVRAIENAAADAAADAAANAVKDQFNKDVTNAAAKAGIDPATIETSQPVQNSVLTAEPTESGFSWGEEMPAEENQYNFSGTYRDYFEMIFREDFADLSVAKEIPEKFPRRTTYRLSRGGAVALVVELLPDTSSTKKLRNECASQGIPYVRFYYDHDGWWNTRAYVVDRIRKALG